MLIAACYPPATAVSLSSPTMPSVLIAPRASIGNKVCGIASMANRIEQTHNTRVRLLSGIQALLALWLIACPWVIGDPGRDVARSGIAVGVVTLLLAMAR